MPEFTARVKDPNLLHCFRPGGESKSQTCSGLIEFLENRLPERVAVECLPLRDDGIFRAYISYPTGDERVVDILPGDTVVVSPYGKLWVYSESLFREHFEIT